MTDKEAIKRLKNIDIRDALQEDYDALHMAIQALEQQPSDDCISREAVENITWEEPSYTDVLNVLTEVREKIRQLPSVTAQQKIGHWEWVQYDSNTNIGNWHCSECRTIIPHMPVETDRTPIYRWCPMCGAKMEVEE